MQGAFSWAKATEYSVGHEGSSTPALLGSDDVPPGIWNLESFPVEGGRRRGMKVAYAAHFPPHGLKPGCSRSRADHGIGEGLLAGLVHTNCPEGVPDKHLLTLRNSGWNGSPGRNRIFRVTQRKVSVMSCTTVNVPCYLELFGWVPRCHLMILTLVFA